MWQLCLSSPCSFGAQCLEAKKDRCFPSLELVDVVGIVSGPPFKKHLLKLLNVGPTPLLLNVYLWNWLGKARA